MKIVENPRKNETLIKSFDVDISRMKKDFGFECKHIIEDVIK